MERIYKVINGIIAKTAIHANLSIRISVITNIATMKW
jgi:hypothetical protein